jgi:hypothetical protein
MKVLLNTSSIEDYRTFLRIKSLPKYSINGHVAEFPDEYASQLGLKPKTRQSKSYTPPEWMFDYQRAIDAMTYRKRNFALFIDCGYGKTALILQHAKNAYEDMNRKRLCLIVSPLMVIKQTINECRRFFGDSYQLQQIRAASLQDWLLKGEGIGITNYEAITPDLCPGKLGCLNIDEASMLKSHYGKWGTKLIELGKGLQWKLTATGTPAPNDRIEYANQAVFLDQFPTVNSFLAKFFVNKCNTGERWILKPHALAPFYKALSHWSIFLTNPATYGWKDNCTNIPPIKVHIHDVDLTQEQHSKARELTGDLFATPTGGIGNRSVMAQIAKGNHKGEKISTEKPRFIRELVDEWEDKESTIIWCRFNAEQERLAELFPDAANISGDTPEEKRQELLDAFKTGEIKTMLTKPKILGFGQNLQICTRQVFSTCHDSFEEYYQAVKRSNRVGSTLPLNVHLPITELERPMLDNVLRKAGDVERDTREQERIFKECGNGWRVSYSQRRLHRGDGENA